MAKKKFSDYRWLYPNTPVYVKRYDDKGVYHFDSDPHIHSSETQKVKLILRPIQSMSEKDVIHLVSLRSEIYTNVRFVQWMYQDAHFEFEYKSSSRRRREHIDFGELNPQQFKYMLENHFDMFDLIDSNIALDVTKFKKEIQDAYFKKISRLQNG